MCADDVNRSRGIAGTHPNDVILSERAHLDVFASDNRKTGHRSFNVLAQVLERPPRPGQAVVDLGEEAESAQGIVDLGAEEARTTAGGGGGGGAELVYAPARKADLISRARWDLLGDNVY
ncbi:uncharacterized protein LACBIDRAFT_323953 [Laccaria bicolor S238N-H82]|uniref:Predicted protein n=1 Tax=Laccaria bicolor (strain S238N-H82 / ATCC MYA-4686) TaxID=486041 RepID=B0D058_LACBS|nr:uncharacterized protein LACBIDRAFT_323953 [Laccaria bicolor S238N-H82]EDR11771.1 predicted protein [Laccaria bicolor S238N-H82]|eukprot:XP_001877668.1 predicted protein [Laccaria bicolor S238N-H82]